MYGKLNAFEKANSAKLVMQLSEKEGEPEPVWKKWCHFLRTRILGTACEDRLSLIFFGPEPTHVPFGTEHKHITYNKHILPVQGSRFKSLCKGKGFTFSPPRATVKTL